MDGVLFRLLKGSPKRVAMQSRASKVSVLTVMITGLYTILEYDVVLKVFKDSLKLYCLLNKNENLLLRVLEMDVHR